MFWTKTVVYSAKVSVNSLIFHVINVLEYQKKYSCFNNNLVNYTQTLYFKNRVGLKIINVI